MFVLGVRGGPGRQSGADQTISGPSGEGSRQQGMSGLPLLRAVWRSAVIGVGASKPNGLTSCNGLRHTLLRPGLPYRAIHITPNFSNVKSPAEPVEEELSPFTKLIEAMGFTGPLKYSKWKIKIAGLRMYTCCVERIDYDDLFERCNLSDTLNSWFLVAQLHVWMALVRMKQEGREGKYMCKYIVHSMWEDLEQRGKVMGVLPDLLVSPAFSVPVSDFQHPQN
ncbi:ubiquinol-cytochrome-c reductase complex assembly factor 1 isoform X3 [Chiloscyllium plagiosum]|uniref:ubiquinol-cytochrome-c reductase complex assembly factor 1 isoform X3 n=1 Tax=Chiloscyllium plagiosum TaxID=36176 RepID=UPI001CB7C303|nr:ubiquinol-cytochrome-c reductase complex assembly factor 1 isoform X3 [Chiloscyllium plagiosum]